jgi:hypothetical protein
MALVEMVTGTTSKGKIPEGLSSTAKEFLEACMKRREEALHLFAYEFVRDISNTSVIDFIPRTPPPMLPHHGLLASTDSLQFVPPPANSRFKNDFDEIEEIGSGGFGVVVKVKNKLDGRFYAIKKIILNSRKQVFGFCKMVENVSVFRKDVERSVDFGEIEPSIRGEILSSMD